MSDDTTNQQFNEMLGALGDVQQAMHQAAVQATTADPRKRRLMRAIADLGMPVPDNWVQLEFDDEGNPVQAHFASLSWRALDKLVCLLEDLAENRQITVVHTRSGPTLFDEVPMPSPQPARAVSSFHMEVPR